MNELKRILFVDDSPSVLASLEAVLRSDRKRWAMTFALGGERAISELRKTPFDVVVSDMRMPDVDGAAVLNVARDECPATVRIMLTGYASNESIGSLMPSLHQLLGKPCDAKTLRSALERSLGGIDVQRDACIRKIVGSVAHLPSPPDLFFELSRLMQSPSAGIADIANVVVRDPALSAKVLQLANSSYFGTGQVTKSIHQAVAVLGIEQLRSLALTTSVLAAPKARPPVGFSVDALQRSSLRTATLARALAEPACRDEAFASGLLHHLGELVLALSGGADHGALRERVERGEGVLEVELDQFGATHADVGAHLLAIWGLPLTIVDAVHFHHDPGAAPDSARALASVVHVAAALADAPTTTTALDLPSLERAGCAHLVEGWQAIAARLGPQ